MLGLLLLLFPGLGVGGVKHRGLDDLVAEALRDVRADVPAELNRLITRCLRKDPGRRVQSMADLKVAFDELREEIDSGRATVPATPVAPVALASAFARSAFAR